MFFFSFLEYFILLVVSIFFFSKGYSPCITEKKDVGMDVNNRPIHISRVLKRYKCSGMNIRANHYWDITTANKQLKHSDKC